MDPQTMIFSLANFAVAIAIAIMLSYVAHRKNYQSIKYVLFSSTFLAVSLIFLYFDIEKLLEGGSVLIFTFFTFFFLSISLALFAKAINELYGFQSMFSIYSYIAFALTMSIIEVIATNMDSYQLRGLGFIIIIIAPCSLIIYNLKRNGITLLKNTFFYQILCILAFLILNIVTQTLFNDNPSLHVANSSEVIYVLVITIIIIAMDITYLIELHYRDLSDISVSKTMLEVAYKDVKKTSETDMLTNLHNRHKINEYTKQLKRISDNSDTTFSLIMCDVNDFKNINDTFGHNMGDEVLKFISDSLLKVVRSNDIIGRWGGDEFIILINDSSKPQTEVIVEKIMSFFRDNPFEKINKFISLSIGYSIYDSGTEIQDVIDEADKLMYEEKFKHKSNQEFEAK